MTVLCIENCYIDRYYEEGREYQYDGPTSPYLVAADPAAGEETTSKKAGRKPANLNPANQGA